MSIDRPRRIFRASNRTVARPGVGRALVLGLAGAASGAALMLLGLTSDLFGHVSFGLAEIAAEAAQVAVIDGGTLRLGGVVVRLGDVVPPAPGEDCAAGPDCGKRAAAALAGLVQNRRVACRVGGYDPAGRPVARCQAAGRDIGAALVEIGWARAGVPELGAVQNDARAHRRGIWLAG